MNKLLDSFKYAFQGIKYSFHTQRNIRIHFCIAIIVLFMGTYLRLNNIEWAVILLTISIVVTGEMVNTAIEKTIDLVTEEYKLYAKIAKDVAAGAVLISSIMSLIIGILIFYQKIFK